MTPSVLVVTSLHDVETAGSTAALLPDSSLWNNCPELRKRRILAAVRTLPCASVALARRPDSPSLCGAARVHSARYRAFLATAHERFTRALALSPTPVDEGNVLEIDAHGAGSGSTKVKGLVPAQCAPRDALQRPGSSLAGQVAYFGCDRFTPLLPHTLLALRWDIAVVRAACAAQLGSAGDGGDGDDDVASGGVRAGDFCAAYALTTLPGHHAGPEQFGGYCFVNQAAVAAEELLARLKEGGAALAPPRVAILDVDHHCGNGTEAVFWQRPDVFVVSLHADPELDYPATCGFADQVGAGEGKGTTLNLPLPPDAAWDGEYGTAFTAALAAIEHFDAGALVISLGLDALATDPEALSKLGLAPRDFGAIGRRIGGALPLLPTVVVQEGGYGLEEVPQAVAHMLEGLAAAAAAATAAE